MKKKIKKLVLFIFNIPLGIAVIGAIILYCIYYTIKDIYHRFRFHFSDVAQNLSFWVILIPSVLIIAWVVDKLANKKNKNG
jgi:hypothetical protein